MQQTINAHTETKKTTTPRKGYCVIEYPSMAVCDLGPTLSPETRFAITLLQLGELESERLRPAFDRDERVGCWHSDPTLWRIGEQALELPNPLCDAILLLLDGWYRHAHTLEAMQTEQRQQAQECQP